MPLESTNNNEEEDVNGAQEKHWSTFARCRGADVDPELFFAADGERHSTKQLREERAKSVCAECPVATECRTAGTDPHIEFGIWGGMNEAERESRFRWGFEPAPKLRYSGGLQVDATPARRMLQALARAGYSTTEVALATGLAVPTLAAVRSGGRSTIVEPIAQRLAQTYPELIGRAPMGPAAAQIKESAFASGWASHSQWQGRDMADPAAVPLSEGEAA
ncbi:hypothetical protein BJF83_22415 [Nocardiopsis sp. CNR-923]|uniref:WhiB family transcriptional regulator n=1 Tax=Nocardiopsis sp. CNR-923 TaxID=1904965 RepID=UPI000969730D|nr:WhiB family transcriptional regulator [Nocardiopsis sp. CNR-923]OLT25838.1 hypothetical protein BJF83_22415 [Nocardiopsis sp. CNR-923]